MTIKERIGARIKAARHKAGLTMREVSEMSQDLKTARLSNWEQGLRTPGPEEIILLSKLLGVSAAYLMCLSDEVGTPWRGDPGDILMVPVYDEATILRGDFESHSSDTKFLPLDHSLGGKVSEQAFAFRITDDSMSPEFFAGDLVVVDPSRKPSPGQIVLANMNGQIVVRKIRDRGDNGIQLTPINEDWPTKSVQSLAELTLLATVVEHRRVHLKEMA